MPHPLTCTAVAIHLERPVNAPHRGSQAPRQRIVVIAPWRDFKRLVRLSMGVAVQGFPLGPWRTCGAVLHAFVRVLHATSDTIIRCVGVPYALEVSLFNVGYA